MRKIYNPDELFKAALRNGDWRVKQIFARFQNGEPINTPEEEAEEDELECMRGLIDWDDVYTTNLD